ncbi:1-deoxy-D-xylulose-5-phosphate reductoisomerase [Spiroplasma turonicum]|uniref:1-deoxy-D-xylulose 5-phosphate reductoisomerase n=1 Tax=Spiroplasma turonicum TaxID=216946 RepID=A0A0K1P5F0_9MOLU|nr:1-deoxy-D-xylulose-5-phosphate reductoisomerase [Spiroplasma turonicum]AKU79510.1 1-deoxy-D-xylulose 5-phosphate reductoisomerase [Spiroplasma turonicum]ALX70533.1 1-deoxy-D-xylulose 5-phosphate reductoisomerase [Spiroplasma turonicum]
MKKIVLFGASGSIGTQSLEILKDLKDKYELVGIAVGERVDLVKSIIESFPTIKIVYSKIKINDLQSIYKDVIFTSEDILDVLNITKANIVINALSGIFGLNITIESIKKNLIILNANKESIVVAGNLINKLLLKYPNAKLYPIDSEHCAIFQCLESINPSKIILTASGGPFRDYTLEETKKVTIKDALNHPNWSMGNKISIDSATMFNKALEIIEAYHLFKTDNIDVVIHKESYVHSMVMFEDNSIKAQLSIPDMKQVINYFLNYPKRVSYKNKKDFDWINGFGMSFKLIDTNRFLPIKMAYECLNKGNSKSISLNAANEICVDLFLQEKIRFNEITTFVKKIFDNTIDVEFDTIDDIYNFDNDIRIKTLKLIGV